MKTTITTLCMAFCGLCSTAQTVADFESFTLAPNSAYTSTASVPFQTSNAVFEYNWDPSFGGYWALGFAYTNKQDSSNGTFNNLYGVRALTGYTNSPMWVIGQNGSTLKLKSPFDVVQGFYITNTTYAYKAIKSGNSFSRKFGDTTGTGSGTTIPQGYYPDFFKITAKGFKNGTMKPDSAVFYLADYRFSNNTQDYIVNTWQWFNIASLGSVDSIRFTMFSSDMSFGFINTPGFFAMDNFATTAPNPVGISKINAGSGLSAFPNPFTGNIIVRGMKEGEESTIKIKDVSGKEIHVLSTSASAIKIDTEQLSPGIYFIEMSSGDERRVQKLIKN